MKDDRCHHVPTSPGQSMCSCQDYRMTLELTIELLCRHVATLERRLQKAEPKLVRPGRDTV